MTSNRIKWEPIIEEVKAILAYFEGEETKATLRAVFYRLVSDNSLPNTVSMYQSLSRHLVKAQKEGVISFDALTDSGRYSIEHFGDDYLDSDDLETVKECCAQKIGYIDIDSVIDNYFNYKYMVLNPPENAYRAEQPSIAVVWIEKDAVAPSIQNWTSGLCTTIYFYSF